jgi:hypothetical protein
MRPMLVAQAPASLQVVREFAKAAKDSKSPVAKVGKTGGKKGGKKGKKGGDDDGGYDGSNDELDHKYFDKFLWSAQEASRTPIDWPEEVAAAHLRISKNFTIQSFVRHQRLQKDLANKIWLMSEAMAALPPFLQEAAEAIDVEAPPVDRPWAAWSTPPIKGFDSSPYEDTKEEDDDDDEVEKTVSK